MKAQPFISALAHQRDIYLQGLSGRKPEIPFHPDALEEKAQQTMSKAGFAYIAGGAGLESTVRENRQAFERWKIIPRMLRDVNDADTTTELFGKRLPFPLLLSPVGVLDVAHKQADLAVGKAAASMGTPYIFSNQASVPMETVAQAMGTSPRWFQLYWSKSNELVASLVKRAEACGCGAIVVTLDTTMLGWRIRDLDLGYLPFLMGKGIAQYVSDPVFQRLMDEPDKRTLDEPKRRLTPELIGSVLELMRNYPGGFWQNLRSGRPLKAVRKFISLYTNPALQWSDLPFLREQTRLPILLKGILHPDDARRAVDEGIDGLIVSNHGGRQVDGVISAIEALPGIAAVVEKRIPIIMDSGIRGGADMFKAIALGARAVCIGRPYVYGLALAGENGVRQVIQNFRADFELTMRLSGCKSVKEINVECLQ